VLINSQNCTACYGGCATCDNVNPSICLTCSPLDYMDNSSLCQPCPSACATCATATVCTSCNLVSYLDAYDGKCYPFLDYPCASQVANTCTSCYGGYTLKASTHTCVVYSPCNSTATCTSCPLHYYLKSKKCLPCKTSSVTCNYCSPTTPATCLTCALGYYMGTDCYTCDSAQQGCLTCSSDITCLTTADGYYISIDAFGQYTGIVVTCPSSCATCASPTCTTCATSYIRVGTLCMYETFVSGTITLGPGPGTPWFT
jgi:hypothetical protein